MAKRYHTSNNSKMKKNGQKKNGNYRQTAHDRYDESRGMKHYEEKRRMADYKDREYYAGPDARYRREYDDSRMIHEDRDNIANLPGEYYIKAYPKTYTYRPSRISDTIIGVDVQMDEDASMTKRELYPEKY